MRWEDRGQGVLRRNLSGKTEYRSFMPTQLQDAIPLELDQATVTLLGSCSRKLGELEGMLKFIPSADMYLAMYARKEAFLSAQVGLRTHNVDRIIEVSFAAERLGVSRTTANNLVRSFVDLGILVQRNDGRQRYRTFLYEDYLEILRQGGEPL